MPGCRRCDCADRRLTPTKEPVAKLTLEELRDERENLMSRIAAARSERYPYRTTDQEISDMQEEVDSLEAAIFAADNPDSYPIGS